MLKLLCGGGAYNYREGNPIFIQAMKWEAKSWEGRKRLTGE